MGKEVNTSKIINLTFYIIRYQEFIRMIRIFEIRLKYFIHLLLPAKYYIGIDYRRHF